MSASSAAAPAAPGVQGRRSLVGWVAAAAGLGILASVSAAAAAAAAVSVFLLALPWWALFGLLAIASLFQRWSVAVAGYAVTPGDLVVGVFAIRAFGLSKRSRFGKAEWILLVFMVIQVVASVLHAADVRKSLLDAGLLGFGVLAYLAMTTAIATPKRLRMAAKIFLWAIAAAAAAGLAALAVFYVSGNVWGITRVDTLRGFPAIQGIAYEHDVFGSTCAAGALAFIVLWRESSALLTRRATIAGAWLCLAGLVLSLSRGAWVGFVVGLGLLLITMPRARRSLVGFAVAGGLVVVAAGLGVWYFGPSSQVAGVESATATTVGTQASQTLNFTTSTGALRLAEWKGALQEVRASPVLGLGTNSWGQRHFESTRSGAIPAFLGNWFVRTLYDSGAVGLFLLLWFLGFVAWPRRAVRIAQSEDRGDDAPAIARAFVFASAGLLVCYLATDALLLVWPWLLFGLARSARRLATSEP